MNPLTKIIRRRKNDDAARRPGKPAEDAPRELDQNELKQVGGGTSDGSTSLPKGSWKTPS